MDNYFIKGFLKNNFIGINGVHKVFEHFNRNNQSLEETIYIIIKACKSVEEWTLEVRLPEVKSPVRYGYSKSDLLKMELNKQIEVLQYYCNIYVLYHHLEKMSRNKLDIEYKNKIDCQKAEELGGDLFEYITKAKRTIMDNFRREI